MIEEQCITCHRKSKLDECKYFAFRIWCKPNSIIGFCKDHKESYDRVINMPDCYRPLTKEQVYKYRVML